MSIINKLMYKTLLTVGIFVEKDFISQTKNPLKVNSNTLFRILNHNSRTEIGRKYKFKEINSIQDFKNSFPLTEYNFYDNYIAKMAAGEKDILVKDELEYFCHTSGTTGKQKLIPVTKKSRLTASKYMGILLQKFAYNNFKENWSYGKGLLISDMVTTTYTSADIPICSATSGGMKSIKHIFPYMYTSPIEIMYIKDKTTSLYLHLLFALKEKKLMYIGGVFISNILDLLRELKKNSQDLMEDIKKGRVNKKLDIDKETRKNLNSYLSPNASRSEDLEREFKKGFKGICKRIWPNLAYITCVTGATFSIYDEAVNFYTDNLPIYSPCLSASEGTIGINRHANEFKYIIIPDTVFYEFIDTEDSNKKNPKTFCINELKIGRNYEIVLTNYAGLYRYRLGDVIKVTNFYNSCPEVIFLYRKNQVLNMASEKTTEDHITSAIKNTIKQFNVKLIDYTTLADNSNSPGKYIFYMEFNKSISPDFLKKIQSTLDLELQKSNIAYGRFRKNKRLDNLKIIPVSTNTFFKIKESLYKKGISKNQIKIPRVITNNKKILSVINDNLLYKKK